MAGTVLSPKQRVHAHMLWVPAGRTKTKAKARYTTLSAEALEKLLRDAMRDAYEDAIRALKFGSDAEQNIRERMEDIAP